jgi:hypothetical protein
MTPLELFAFLPIGYLISILIETPILVVGLSARHSLGRRLAAGLWLTACTYPIVVLVLRCWLDPSDSRLAYLAAAETFAPVAECLLFLAAFGTGGAARWRSTCRDVAVITAANLASFCLGELLYGLGWFGSGI